jgi:hypothetical protein
MGVQIESGNQADTFWVNSKCVYMNSDGKWICDQELTTAEQQFFAEHCRSMATKTAIT